MTDYLKKLRVDAKLTQSDLAKKMGYKTAQYVSNWERGLALPPRYALKRLARILGQSHDSLKELYIETKIRKMREAL